MKNSAISERKNQSISRGVGMTTQIYADRAENAEIWDVEGRRYIDFAAGIAVVNTGHRHPRVIEAVKAQLDRFTHTCHQVVPYENYVAAGRAAERHAARQLREEDDLRHDRRRGRRERRQDRPRRHRPPAVIAFAGGFHGRTFMGMALTGKVVPYKVGFGAMPGDVFHAPFPVALHGVTVDDSLAALDRLFKADVDPTRVAAIIIEPVQGEGGFYDAPRDFLTALRKLCDQHGILLIADEVQTGFARTGKMFAMDHHDVARRPHHHGQEPGRRLPAGGRHRPRRDHGCARPRRPRRHLWRQPDRRRRGPCGARRDRGREAVRPRQHARRPTEAAPAIDPRRRAGDRRHPRASAS